PIMLARRRADGEVEEMPATPGEGVGPESLMHVEVDRIVSPDKIAALTADLTRVLGDVRRAVTDWKKMQAKVGEALSEIQATRPPPLAPREGLQSKGVLGRPGGKSFPFPGLPLLRLEGGGGERGVARGPNSRAGILGGGRGKTGWLPSPPVKRAPLRPPA